MGRSTREEVSGLDRSEKKKRTVRMVALGKVTVLPDVTGGTAPTASPVKTVGFSKGNGNHQKKPIPPINLVCRNESIGGEKSVGREFTQEKVSPWVSRIKNPILQ